MLGYLEKFNKLPLEIRNKVSNERSIAIIERLEKKYKIALAVLIMKVMAGELGLNNLADSLLKENLSKREADELARELKEKIFSSLDNYFSAGAVQPVKPVAPVAAGEPKVKGASFFFSPDDEEEIRQLTKKIVMAENSGLPSGAIDDKLAEIISRAQINFGSADLAGRFSQILRTYLRGVRNKLEIKAALMKPFLNGGLSFDEDSAQKIMLLADKVLNSSFPAKAGPPAGRSGLDQPIRPAPEIRPPEPVKSDFFSKGEISRDLSYDFSKLNLKAKADRIKNDLKKLDTGRELPAPMPAILPSPKNDPEARPLIKRRFKAENLSQSQKVKIEDVKYVPRVMSPLDELRYLDLTNFRRLDLDPLKSAAKIKSKIDLLAEEDYGKKLEGIKLWRLSPVNKLYLEIGHLSISENKPVDVIIEERKMAGADYLTADEFKAVMDLNKNLRF